MTEKYLRALQDQLPNEEVVRLLEPKPSLCIAIKTHAKGYVYANHNYLKLMGYSSLNEFLHKTDADLYTDKKVLQFVKNDDEQVFDLEKPLRLEGDIRPVRHPKLVKSMEGMAYPLLFDASRPEALVTMCEPKNKLIALTSECLLMMATEQLQNLLVRSSYPIVTSSKSIRLARMEILAFAEILKGKHAGEISDQLKIKQVTVEAYLSNLKNKCGVGKKSDLTQYLVNNKIFEKIIV